MMTTSTMILNNTTLRNLDAVQQSRIVEIARSLCNAYGVSTPEELDRATRIEFSQDLARLVQRDPVLRDSFALQEAADEQGRDDTRRVLTVVSHRRRRQCPIGTEWQHRGRRA